MNTTRTLVPSTRKVVTALVAVAAVAAPSAAHAAEDVVPADGGYYYSVGWADVGGAKDIAIFDVGGTGTYADLDTLRSTCVQHYGVMHTFTGKSGRVAISDGQFTKSRKVKTKGSTAKITLHVAWSAPEKAKGWLRVTGKAFGHKCTGKKEKFTLTYSK